MRNAVDGTRKRWVVSVLEGKAHPIYKINCCNQQQRQRVEVPAQEQLRRGGRGAAVYVGPAGQDRIAIDCGERADGGLVALFGAATIARRGC